ncbi:MAG: iron-sulfur cluster assembly protein [Prevotellaceae bacterium]|jgi:FeS assembly SUF system protein|nr:iron-sulfur cluster assembly protein [Prevotellaceae bacterium]
MIELEKKIITVLKNVYDPEIPVNIYDLGLIYEIITDESNVVHITMTLTAPNCPMADELVDDVHSSVKALAEVSNVIVKLTFEPPWDKSMMTEEALLELGLM